MWTVVLALTEWDLSSFLHNYHLSFASSAPAYLLSISIFSKEICREVQSICGPDCLQHYCCFSCTFCFPMCGSSSHWFLHLPSSWYRLCPQHVLPVQSLLSFQEEEIWRMCWGTAEFGSQWVPRSNHSLVVPCLFSCGVLWAKCWNYRYKLVNCGISIKLFMF